MEEYQALDMLKNVSDASSFLDLSVSLQSMKVHSGPNSLQSR